METKCIQMRNVTKKFRDFKLDNVSLEVPQGEIEIFGLHLLEFLLLLLSGI